MSDSPKRVCYCIEVLDDNDNEWKIAYIGETFRGEVERDGEHEGLVGGASRVAASVAVHGRANHRVRIIDIVNDDADRKALETYLMLKHNTILKQRTRMLDLLAHENRAYDHVHPDISLEGRPRNFQLNQRRSVGDKFQERVDAAGKAYEARCSATTLSLFTVEEERALFDEADADLLANVEVVELREHLKEPLTRALVARASTADTEGRIVFVVDSAFMCSWEKRVKYEGMVPSDVIDGNQLFRDVKSVREFVVDDCLDTQMRQLYLIVHPDKHTSMPAGGVAALFKLIEQLAGVIEEAALVAKAKEDADVKKHLAQAKEWFEYMRNNGGTIPTVQPTAKHKSLDEKKREKYLGKQMMNWRVGNNGAHKQLQRNLYLVVLRDFETFAAFCYGRGEKSKDVAANVNAMLLLGYGTTAECKKHPDLLHFPTGCVTCKQLTKEYGMWSNYLRGQVETNEEALLANLPPERVATAKDMRSGKFEATKAAKAENRKKQKEAAHASGLVTPRAKKAKTTS